MVSVVLGLIWSDNELFHIISFSVNISPLLTLWRSLEMVKLRLHSESKQFILREK